MLRTKVLLAACAAGLLAVVGCSAAQAPPIPTPDAPEQPTPASPTSTPNPTPTAPPAFEASECAFDPPFGTTIECGYLTVPAHRNGGTTGEIRLHVAVIPSDSADRQPDPVVYLAGGPGERALQSLNFLLGPLQDIARDRDLIVFDQRGVGFSEPDLYCDETVELTYETLDVALEEEEAERLWLEALMSCRDRLTAEGIDLSAFSTRENAADVRDLRIALGYDEWNLVGISYGTRLGLTVLRDHPEGIRSVILDSAYPLDVNLYESIPGNTDRVFSVLAEACAADPECSAAYPDIGDQIRTAYERLEAEPQSGLITHPFTGETFDAVVDGNTFISQLFLGLYSTDIIPLLPEMVTDAAAGEIGIISALGGVSLLNLEFLTTGMQMSIQCQEDIAGTSIEALRSSLDAHPDMRPYFEGVADYGSSLIERCEMWGAMGGHQPGADLQYPDIPTLVLAGEFDPITPPEWGQRAAESVPQGTYLEFPGLAHGVVGNECARGIQRQFLQDPSAALDASCIDALGPPSFVLPLEQTDMVPFEDIASGLTGVRPTRWQQVDVGIYVRSGLGETGLIFQALPVGAGGNFAELMLQQLGIPGPAEPLGTREGNGLVWTYYEAVADQSVAFVATTEATGADLAVVAAGMEGKADSLRERVFFPAVDALTLLE